MRKSGELIYRQCDKLLVPMSIRRKLIRDARQKHYRSSLMKSRSKTKFDDIHLQKITELGCIASILNGDCSPWSETVVVRHHIFGKTKPGCHLLTIPLLEKLHDYGEAGSLHKNKSIFVKRYGTEKDLWHFAMALIYPEQIPDYYFEILENEKYSTGFINVDLYESFKK